MKKITIEVSNAEIDALEDILTVKLDEAEYKKCFSKSIKLWRKIVKSYDSQVITVNPNIKGGTPVVTGTRIPVRAIFYLNKKLKKSPEVIATKYYTQLSVDTIKEVLKTK